MCSFIAYCPWAKAAGLNPRVLPLLMWLYHHVFLLSKNPLVLMFLLLTGQSSRAFALLSFKCTTHIFCSWEFNFLPQCYESCRTAESKDSRDLVCCEHSWLSTASTPGNQEEGRVSACFDSTYTKTGTRPRRLAWPQHKDEKGWGEKRRRESAKPLRKWAIILNQWDLVVSRHYKKCATILIGGLNRFNSLPYKWGQKECIWGKVFP